MPVHNTHTAVQSMSYVVGRRVRGVTCLDNIMYVVCYKSSTIRLYDTQTYSQLDVVIDVNGMKYPQDITVCRDSRQLFVADEVGWLGPECCIWRVSVDDHSYVKWLMSDASTTHRFRADSLSVTSQRLLVKSSPRSLHQYNTTDRQLLRVVELPQFVWSLHHAVETTRGTFVVSHNGTAQSKARWQSAVSNLFAFAVNIFAQQAYCVNVSCWNSPYTLH